MSKAIPATNRNHIAADILWKQRFAEKFDIGEDLGTMQAASDTIHRHAIEKNRLMREELRAAEQDLDATKALIMLEKVTGTNAELRKASLDRELATDAGYQLALKAYSDLKLRIENLDAEMRHEMDRWTAAKAAVAYKTAMIQLLAL